MSQDTIKCRRCKKNMVPVVRTGLTTGTERMCPFCGTNINTFWEGDFFKGISIFLKWGSIFLIGIGILIFILFLASILLPKKNSTQSAGNSVPLSTLPNPKSQSLAVDPHLIIQFEKSEVFQKYEFREKSQWKLNTGGVNFYYVFTDPDSPDEKSTIEMSADQENISTVGIIFRGRSALQPAKPTISKEEFLYNVLHFFYPKLDFDELMALIRAEGGISYDGGSGSMPRKKFNAASVYVGTVGPDLIVGIESQRTDRNLSEPDSKAPYHKDTSPSPASSKEERNKRKIIEENKNKLVPTVSRIRQQFIEKGYRFNKDNQNVLYNFQLLYEHGSKMNIVNLTSDGIRIDQLTIFPENDSPIKCKAHFATPIVQAYSESSVIFDRCPADVYRNSLKINFYNYSIQTFTLSAEGTITEEELLKRFSQK